jgi:hypothetical protein
MGSSRQYFTLITSLPRLKRFDEETRLPINPQRLRERLSMLDPEDVAIVEEGANLMAWQRQPLERTDEELIVQYELMRERVKRESLWQMFEINVDVRTIMAALRRRHLGFPAPKEGERWGLGRWVKSIERNWTDPDFRIASVHPWIPRARKLMASGDALELERLVMGFRWDRLDYLAGESFFGFEAVLAYVLKWDMMQRWLAYDVNEAKVRFDELIAEAIDGKEG